MDGRTVEELPGHLKAHGPEIREALLVGRYQPQPVKRVEMPNPGGGGRTRGIPTVLERFIQHALWQVLQPAWAGTFSDGSDGFRPGRSAHHASAKAQPSLKAGHSGVVDLDREQFFARVKQDQLMSRVKERGTERRVWPRIDRDRKAGALTGDGFEATPEGTPQGGPWSSRRAHLRRDGWDQEWAKRGHRFVRDAEDCNLYGRSARAGARVLARGTRDLKRQLRLVGNAAKRAVDRPWRRTFLGLSFTGRQPNRRQGRVKALKAYKQEIRRLTQRPRGVSLPQVAQEVRRDVTAW
jgi:RNA-directed DNA polymerase